LFDKCVIYNDKNIIYNKNNGVIEIWLRYDWDMIEIMSIWTVGIKPASYFPSICELYAYITFL
jgi:hypothetical protein